MAAQTETPNVESRLLAALAHGSVVAQGLGVLVGVVVYTNQRDRSRYAAFQALQAAIYQLISLIIVVGIWIAWSVFYVISLIPVIQQAERTPDAPPPPIFWIGLGSMVIPCAIMVAIGLYGLWAGLQVWRAKDFRYALLGAWLERSALWQTDSAL